MPPKGNKKYRRRSSNKWKKWKRSNRPGNNGNVLGRTFKTKLKYVRNFNLTATGTGDVATHKFYANGIFNPNVTDSADAHQPMGFDQIKEFYNHYTVIGSKIKVKAIGDSNPNVLVGCRLADNMYVPGDVADILERGDLSYRHMTHTNASYNYPAQRVSLTRKFSAERFFGVKGIIGNDDYTAPIGQSPQEGAFYNVFVAPISNTEIAGTIQCTVEIEYVVVFTEPKNLMRS